MIKEQYEFKFEDKEHKQEFEEYLNGQEYVSYKKARPTKKLIRILKEIREYLSEEDGVPCEIPEAFYELLKILNFKEDIIKNE